MKTINFVKRFFLLFILMIINICELNNFVYAIHTNDVSFDISKDVNISNQDIINTSYIINSHKRIIDYMIKRSGYKLTICEADKILDSIKIASKDFNNDLLTWKVLFCLCAVESDFNVNAISCKNIKFGYGLCQISSHNSSALVWYNQKNNTHYTINDLNNIDINLKIAVWLLNQYSNQGNLRNILQAYNKGINAYKKSSDSSYFNKIMNLKFKLFGNM